MALETWVPSLAVSVICGDLPNGLSGPWFSPEDKDQGQEQQAFPVPLTFEVRDSRPSGRPSLVPEPGPVKLD